VEVNLMYSTHRISRSGLIVNERCVDSMRNNSTNI